MSDENDNDRAPRAGARGPQAPRAAGSQEGRQATPGPAPNPPKRGPAARTIAGISPPQDAGFGGPRAGLSGHVPGDERDAAAARAHGAAQPERAHDPSSYIADKLYMDPPSEVFARAQTQAAGKVPPAPQPPAANHLLGDTLHASDARAGREPHAPAEAHGPNFVDDALHAAAPHERPAPHAAPRFIDDALHAAAPRERPAPPAAPRFANDALHAAEPRERPAPSAAPRFADDTVDPAQQTVHEHSPQRAPALRTSFGATQAPETWRNDVRRMAQRGGTNLNARPNATAQAAGPASLRLKLDAAADDEDHYRGVPKSRLGAVLVWLVILCGLGASVAYWADGEGGVNAVVARVQAVLQGKRPEPPAAIAPNAEPGSSAEAANPAAAAQPPAAAANSAGPGTTPPPSAAPANQPPSAATSQPSAASTTEPQPSAEQAAQDKQARELADPSSAAAETSTPEPAKADATDKLDKPKPAAAPRPAAPKQAAPRREPIVKVRPLGAAAAPPSGPPAPLDTPYVPAVPDPPAPSDSP